MNATPQVSRAQPSSVTSQLNAGSPAAAPATETGTQDFAQALNDAAGEPVHGNSQGGGQLPLHGKRSPRTSAPLPQPSAETSPPVPVAPGSTPPAAACVATPGTPPAGIVDAIGGGIAGGIAGVALDLIPGLSPGANDAGGAASSAPLGTQPEASLGMPAPIAQPLDLAASDTDGGAPVVAAGVGATQQTSMAPANPTVPAELAPAPAPAAATVAQPPRPARGDAGPDRAAKAAITPAFSNPKTPETSASNTDSDVMAPVIAAAVMQIGAPTAMPAAPPDLAIPDADAKLQNAAASDVSPVPAAAAASASQPAAVAATATATATATAVVAAAVAAAVRTATNTHSMDKHMSGSGEAPSPGTLSDGVGAAAQLTSNGIAANDAPPMPLLKVGAPVDSADFGQGVAGQVSLMVDSHLTSARLQVNPPALGPIEVRIALQEGHAQVWFTSHSALTRDALESSSPQLREMLGAQGFGQVSVDISQRSFQERHFQSQNYAAAPAARSEVAAPALSVDSAARPASGMVDAYA
jgi:flagellar hook-length control protein FliK